MFMNKLIFSKINFDIKDINKYFLTILIFIISLFCLTIILSIGNLEFEYSFKLAVLTLMNTVNSSLYGVSEFDFQNLHYFTKFFLISNNVKSSTLPTTINIIRNILIK